MKEPANFKQQSTAHNSTRTAHHWKLQGYHCWLRYTCVPLQLFQARTKMGALFFILVSATSGNTYCKNQPMPLTLLHKVCFCICLNNRRVTFASWLCDTASENTSLQDRIKQKQTVGLPLAQTRGLPLLTSTSSHLAAKVDAQNSKSCQGLVFPWGLLSENL